MGRFKMGSLDHVHIVVPDRAQAARWYQDKLGFEVVADYEQWARVEGGPLHLSADGGRSAIALFQLGHGHTATTLEKGVAFRVDAEHFVAFARGLGSNEVRDMKGEALDKGAVIDFDLCYAYDFQDPWGNRFELNCYDIEAVKRELIDPDGITAIRYW